MQLFGLNRVEGMKYPKEEALMNGIILLHLQGLLLVKMADWVFLNYI